MRDEIGKLGTFYLTINSTAHDAIEDVDSNSIIKTNIRFRAGAKLKDAITRLSFQKVQEFGAPPRA